MTQISIFNENEICIYWHKLSGDRGTIKSRCENIATCNLIDLPLVNNARGELVYQVMICDFSNLIKE